MRKKIEENKRDIELRNKGSDFLQFIKMFAIVGLTWVDDKKLEKMWATFPQKFK